MRVQERFNKVKAPFVDCVAEVQQRHGDKTVRIRSHARASDDFRSIDMELSKDEAMILATNLLHAIGLLDGVKFTR